MGFKNIVLALLLLASSGPVLGVTATVPKPLADAYAAMAVVGSLGEPADSSLRTLIRAASSPAAFAAVRTLAESAAAASGDVRTATGGLIDEAAQGVDEARTLAAANVAAVAATASTEADRVGVLTDGTGALEWIRANPAEAARILAMLSTAVDAADVDAALGACNSGPVDCSFEGYPLADGASTSRTRYQDASVPYGSSCASEEQVATCSNGSLSVSPNSYAETSCSVEAPALPAGLVARAGDESRYGVQTSDTFNAQEMDGRYYFLADDGYRGPEVWSTDGTEAGTRISKDVCPGLSGGSVKGGVVVPRAAQGGGSINQLFFIARPCPGTNYWLMKIEGDVMSQVVELTGVNVGVQEMAAVGEVVYFVGSVSDKGMEVAYVDTALASPTVGVIDVNPGSASSNPTMLTAAGGKVYVRATSASTGVELFAISGASASVLELKAGSTGSYPSNLTPLPDGRLAFAAAADVVAWEAWVTDGTTAGTKLLATTQLTNNSVSIDAVVLVDNASGDDFLYFVQGGSSNTSLYKINLTSGVLSNVPAPAGWTDLHPVAAAGGDLYLTGSNPADNYELRKLDSAGTYSTLSVCPGTCYGYNVTTDKKPLVLGGYVYFPGVNAAPNATPYALYRTNGGAPELVYQAAQISTSRPAFGVMPASLGSTLVFRGDDGIHGLELWRSDGTTAGTRLVRDINSRQSPPTSLTLSGDHVFFSASLDGSGSELYAWNHQTSQLSPRTDIGPGLQSGCPSPLVPYDGGLFFAACVGGNTSNYEPFFSDGSTATLIQDLAPAVNRGGINAQSGSIAYDGSVLFISSSYAASGSELYRYTAGQPGVALVKDINQTISRDGALSYRKPVQANGLVFFVADDGTHGYELWRTDGTEAGTAMVKDVNARSTMAPEAGYCEWASGDYSCSLGCQLDPGAAGCSAMCEQMGCVGQQSDPLAYCGEHPDDQFCTGWCAMSDFSDCEYECRNSGCLAATTANTESSYPAPLAAVADGVFFVADDGPSSGLWFTDGSDVGTRKLTTNECDSNTGPTEPVAVAGGATFSCSTPANGFRTFFASSQAGVPPVMWGAPHSTTQASSALSAGLLYFVDGAGDPVSGQELWVSDGTDAGTHMVKDVAPGPTSGSTQGLLYPDGAGGVYFKARSGTGPLDGYDIYHTDGTEAGTHMVVDLPAWADKDLRAAVVDADHFYYIDAREEGGEGLFYYGPAGGGGGGETGGACDLNLVDPSTDCDAYCGDEVSRQECQAVQSNF